MTDIDLRAKVFNFWISAGDSLDGFEVTVDDPSYAAGTWTAQIRATPSDAVVQASFQIVPNGAGTGVVCSLDDDTVRALHDAHARVVRDPELGLVNRSEHVYDVQSTYGANNTLTAVKGTITIDQDVTR